MKHWTVLLLLLVLPTMLLAQDSASVPTTPGMELLTGVGTLIGLGAVWITGLLKGLVTWIDDRVTVLDGKLTAIYKPVQPLVAMVLSYVIVSVPLLNELDPESVVAAPVGVLVGIAIREVFVRLRAA